MSTTRTRVISAGVGLLAAVAMTMPTAGAASLAAPTEPGGQGKGKTSAAADVGSDGVELTAAAVAAGRAKHGAKATAQQALAAYWTAERMANAIPAEKDPGLARSQRAYEARMKKLQAKGQRPQTNDGPVRDVTGAPSTYFTGDETAAGKGGTGTTENLAAYNPNAGTYTPTAYTQGKVFFTKSGGGNFVCSATIVNSEGADTVWTAGHCVHGGNGGTWHSNWTFVPAYDDDLANPRPFGTWSARQLWTKGAWASNSDFSQDMGVAIMNTRNGWHIVNYFGGQGLTVNRGKSVYERAFGYPAEWPFDGGNLYRCQGTTSPEWDAWIVWSQTVKIGCDMTRGSSGGGWLYGYDGNWGRLNGVNSRIDRILNPTIMLSPYFDNDAWDLYNTTRYL